MHIDLGGGQADARRLVHRLEHVVDQRTQFVVDLLHRRGQRPQARIGEFEDFELGHGAFRGVRNTRMWGIWFILQ
ncbi:hypothetical protein [Alkalisalibacterium limincola]|uniref:hypothetical protein n=1 Tax=Alkalisalibacterium limincola TaxID=2699169 RepID=UPI002107CCB7|nr:hypothetical protein [Alkalisalibacterium limincola]